jgi:hypothetical protein
LLINIRIGIVLIGMVSYEFSDYMQKT